MGSQHSRSHSHRSPTTGLTSPVPVESAVSPVQQRYDKFAFFEHKRFSFKKARSVVLPEGPIPTKDLSQTLKILEPYPISFIATDESNRIVFCNSYAQALMNQSELDVKGKSMDELFLGWSSLALERAKGRMSLFSRNVNKLFEASFSKLIEEESKIVLYHMNEVVDEQMVKLLQTINFTVVEASSIPIIAIDSNCTVKIFNTAAEQVFGYTKEEVATRNINMLMPQSIAKIHDRIIQDYVVGGTNGVNKAVGRTRNVKGLRKDGTEVPIEMTLREIRVSDTYRIFVGLARDRSMLITQSEQSTRSKLALEIFPPYIAQRITDGERFIHDVHESVSIVFCDIVGFTSMSSAMSSDNIVTVINAIFSGIDTKVLDEDHRLEKIKTIGDCYMLVSGLNGLSINHADDAIEASLKMLEVIDDINQRYHDILPPYVSLELRIGINTGEVVAGIAGQTKPCYDVWGSSVNIASRMESTGVPSCIQISKDTYMQLSHANKSKFVLRRGVQMKGVGLVDTYITLKQIPYADNI